MFLPKATGVFSFQAPALLVVPEQRLGGECGPESAFILLLGPSNLSKMCDICSLGVGGNQQIGKGHGHKNRSGLFLKPCATTTPCLSTTLLPFSSSSFRCWLGGLTAAGWLRHCFVRHVNRFGLLSFRVFAVARHGLGLPPTTAATPATPATPATTSAALATSAPPTATSHRFVFCFLLCFKLTLCFHF